MSIHSLAAIKNTVLKNHGQLTSILRREFSRKSVNAEGPFKVVNKSRKSQDNTHLAWRDPNFELLASASFPFFMPGNVGPAWYDLYTTINNEGSFLMEEIEDESDAGIICRAQECPKVLRQTVCELFPHRNLENSELSVITISLKPDLTIVKKNNELETEKLAQTFVLAAKNVCHKLRKAGFWADFVNPFSGRPYFASGSNELYQTDEKFRCLGFQIYEIENCKIVSNEQNNTGKAFVGSLFTSAPSKKKQLNSIFTQL
ncbi:cobalamin trafficking protein CblD-like [Onthophagus taurus]|uniref:cobalamin trafficking protein CblD-like n=1 Tax=Onthophagus taurus TaxID=166361 RepID=UPI000C20C0D6|nr:methylmalonic aciduria and homocystinuria type D homolog, mitochondrial-like [Onthophagus taurus]